MTPIEYDPVGDESFAYVIRGGNPISGTVKPGGNKNAALPMIAASLLADGAVTLSNVPQIRDVRMLLQLISALGADVIEEAPDRWRISSNELSTRALDPGLARDRTDRTVPAILRRQVRLKKPERQPR